MNCTLSRILFDPTGIISNLTDDKSNLIGVTLEHAYPDSNSLYVPKIPDGIYTCVRGLHQLTGMAAPFETFEITGVAGHAGLLFHPGNKNDDSEGCVLTGEQLVRKADESCFVTNSRFIFARFMAMQTGVDQFQLTVESPASN